MNYENEIISSILGNMPVTDKHLSKFFESDSEVIEIEGGKFLFSIDTFSDEDYFNTNDPYLLGKNLAIATITDIFASGGKLLFFSSSLTISGKWSKEYISELSRGLGDTIKSCGAFFAGGDLGVSDNWSFTGVAFGKSSKEISRRGCKPGDRIYLTGEIGSGNFQAAFSVINDNNLKKEPSRHELFLRPKEAEMISEFANTCIDTSDGLIKSLQIISEINETGFEVSNIPYYSEAVNFTQLMGLNKELLLTGECGEYELLFTIDSSKADEFEKIISEDSLNIKNIGTVCMNDTKKVFDENYFIDFSEYNLHARSYKNISEYVSSMISFIKINKHYFIGV